MECPVWSSSVELHGVPCNSLEHHGVPSIEPWSSMECHGTLQSVGHPTESSADDFREFSMESPFHGTPWATGGNFH